MKRVALFVLAVGLLAIMAAGVLVGFIVAAADFVGWLVGA